MKYRLSAGLVLVSSASLMFEIALTRVYAIAQGHHFAFVAIAMALLGIGAAGTLTATSRRLAGAAPTDGDRLGRRTLRPHGGRRLRHGRPYSARHVPNRCGRQPAGMAGALLHRGGGAVHLRRGGRRRRATSQPGPGGGDLWRESGWLGRRGGPGSAAARPGRIGRHDPAGRRPGRSRASRRGASASGHRRRPGQHCPRCRRHRHRARGAASLDPLAARPSPSASRYAPPRHQAVRQFARGHPPERRASHDHRPQPELRRTHSQAPHRSDGRRRKRGGAGRPRCRGPGPGPTHPRHRHTTRRIGPATRSNRRVRRRCPPARRRRPSRPRPARRGAAPSLARRWRRHSAER